MPQSRRSTLTCAQGGQRLGDGAIRHFRTQSALPSRGDVQAAAGPLATCICCPVSLQGSWALVRSAACR